jgi:uncharacterized membrane protein
MHLFFLPFLLMVGLFKILFVVAVIVLIVRLVSRRHYGGPWVGHGQWAGHYWAAPDAQDPRRIAAMRYAAGRIDRAEFERIVGALDASEPGTPPTPTDAPPQA